MQNPRKQRGQHHGYHGWEVAGAANQATAKVAAIKMKLTLFIYHQTIHGLMPMRRNAVWRPRKLRERKIGNSPLLELRWVKLWNSSNKWISPYGGQCSYYYSSLGGVWLNRDLGPCVGDELFNDWEEIGLLPLLYCYLKWNWRWVFPLFFRSFSFFVPLLISSVLWTNMFIPIHKLCSLSLRFF